MAKFRWILIVLFITSLSCFAVPASAEGSTANLLVKAWNYDGQWFVFHYDRQGSPEDWESLDELAAFLDMDNTDSFHILRPGPDGRLYFNGQCEDLAFQLRDRAYEIGKRLETEILTYQECLELYPGKYLRAGNLHMLCKAVVGNRVYLVEPETDKYWEYCWLDDE